MLGKQGTGALVTLVERKSRLYLVKRVASKQAGVVRDAIIEMLTPYIEQVHTITFDNGGEFAEHKAIEEALGAETYFAHPYSSWERGLNENSNGLLRQFIPKGTDLREVTDEDVRRAEQWSTYDLGNVSDSGSLSRYSKSTVRRHRRVSHFEVEFAGMELKITCGLKRRLQSDVVSLQ